jgi:putative flippase GtrA
MEANLLLIAGKKASKLEAFVKLFGRVPRSLKRFLLTGSLTVLLDAAAYAAFLHVGVEVNLAKGLALICATIFAYFVNRKWTFETPHGFVAQFAAFVTLYAAAICLNVAVNRLTLWWLGESHIGYIMSWLLATTSSSIWNYVGMKCFVFRKREAADAT